ncbi:PREDICTED: F-box DNA helicase 1-like [Branchiostoma belcheri]|uniref:F-box DNA helicase 1 n=1 Tax=Branchiostoma belcheri TaxID=7741 RepID=A0A6P5AHP7_BRABE|nr:PREDICTED: F-box DNA helicase 1-like [Branchiostoma belcheri]
MECEEVQEELQSPTRSSVSLPEGQQNGGNARDFEHLKIPPPPKMASTNPSGLAQTTTSAEDGPQEKRRKITMDPGACLEYSNSEVGANPLKNPLLVKKSSKNINEILMPRKPRDNKNGKKVPTTSSGRVFTRFRKASTFTSTQSQGVAGANLAMNNRMKDSKMDDFFIRDNKDNSRNPSKNPCTSSPDKSTHNSKGQNFKRTWTGTQKASTSSTITTETCLRTPTKTSNIAAFSMSSPSSSSQKTSPGAHRVSPGSRVFKWPPKKSSQSVPITTSPDTTTHIFVCSPDRGHVRSSGALSWTSSSSSQISQAQPASKEGEQQQSSLDDSELDTLLANYNMDQCTSQQRTSTDNSNKFGLFGVSSSCHGNDDDSSDGEDSRPNPFEMLPDELLENIFCQMPMLDLCLHLSLVCQRWRELIQRETFIPWKKKYHKLKQGCPETVQEVNDLMRTHSITATKDGCLLQLIRYMSSWQKREEAAILSRLQTHPLSTAAQDLIRTRAKDCLIDGACPAWSVVAAVVVLSTSVSDIQTLLRVLTRHPTPCMIVDVLEGLYCIATLLFSLRTHFKINMGLHYRLFYTLYLYENASSVSCGQLTALKGKPRGQQSMMRHRSGKDRVRLSHEQLRIINHELKPRETIKIIAFAGTGKTTTLVEYTKLRPHMKFLMLAYNKSVQEQAVKIFPGNVECSTVHSLAYSDCGERFQHKLIKYGVKTDDIARSLRKHSRYNYVFAKYVLDTLTNYIASAEDDVTTAHVPDTKPGKGGTKVPISHQDKLAIAEEAQQIWDRMSDPGNRDVWISHDGYLKVYQLSRPQITDYDCLLIDEAQDLTPAINDILLRQDVAKILVGDPHQQIYTFRGAKNAMQETACTHTYYLTQSFRFGPEIAYVAACMLNVLKGVKTKTLVGSSKTGTVLGTKQGQEAVICRMNFTLFNEAVRLTNPSKPPVRIAFVGGLAGYQHNRILDIYYLSLSPEQRRKKNVKVRDHFIEKFTSLRKLKEFAEKAQDVELGGKIKIVEVHRHNTPKFIKRIKERTTDDLKTADVVLTSAHKAKGLEFDTVRLADDFCGASSPMAPDKPEWEKLEEDEKNLLYVAATRAKKSLLLTQTAMLVLKDVQEQFIYPSLTQELLNSGVVLTCTNTRCGQAVPADNLLTMNRRTVTYGTGHGLEAPPGPLCPKCSKLPAPGFRDLLCDPCPGEGGDVEEREEELSDDDDMNVMFFAIHYNPFFNM